MAGCPSNTKAAQLFTTRTRGVGGGQWNSRDSQIPKLPLGALWPSDWPLTLVFTFHWR